MDDIVLQTNIFFYITSVAVVLVTALVIVALFYIVSILRNVKDVSDTVKKGSDVLSEDLLVLHDNVKKEGSKVRQIVDYFLQLITPKRRKKSSKKKDEK